MKIEEVEKIFGKRWGEWTIEEIEQFVRAIEPSQLTEGVVPLILKWACEYPKWLSTECGDILSEMMKKDKKSETKDVHTEHCCKNCGCKYGDEDCPVVTGRKKQSFPCGSTSVCYDRV